MSPRYRKSGLTVFDELTRIDPHRPSHKHWTEPREPGRAVQRRQKRARGEFRPVRFAKTKRRRGAPAAPNGQDHIPDHLFQALSVFTRRGGDR